MLVQHIVEYTVKYRAIIEVETDDPSDTVEAATSEIDIPEGGSNRSDYVSGSFEVENIEMISQK